MGTKENRRVELFTLRLSADERVRLDELAKSRECGAAAVIRTAVNALCKKRGVPLVFEVKA